MAHFVQVWVAGELHHGWGSTHQDQGVLTGAGQVVSDHVLTDEAFTVVPVWNTSGYNNAHYKKSVKLHLCIYYKTVGVSGGGVLEGSGGGA